MADAVLVTTVEAVKAAIEGHNFGRQFYIERNYAEFDVELENLTELRVDVCPVKHSSADMETRGAIAYVTETDICIRRKFDTTDADPDQRISRDAIDELVKFTEDVHEFLVAETMGTDARWSDATILLCPNKRHLRKRQFTSLIRVTHETSKAIP